MFLKMTRGVVFDDRFLIKHELDGFLRVPMSVETFELPTTLINSFKTMMNTFSGVGQEVNITANEAFLSELKKSSDVLMQFPIKEIQQNKMMAQLINAKTRQVARANPESLEEEKKGESAQGSVRTVIDTNASTKGPPVKDGKSPVFLGVDIECDPDYKFKLKNLFT